MPALPVLGGCATGRITSARLSSASEELTVSQLAARAHGVAGDLSAAGVRQGSRVAVGPDADAMTRVLLLLGADVLGAATLLLEPTWSVRERAAVLEDARPDVVVDSATTRSAVVPVAGDPDTLFYLPTTSGSSGRPQVMIRSRRSWRDSFTAFDVDVRPDDTLLVPGPLSSSLFLFATLHGLRSGAAVHLLERWSPGEAAQACRTATVVHLVPPMLNSLLAVLEREPDVRRDCPLRMVICGGAAVDAALRERLARVLPGCGLVEYYGSAEHSVVALRRGDGPLVPATGVEVRVRADGTEVAPGEAGELWVSSGLTFHGRLVSGAVRPREPGSSSVGDTGIRHEDGTLTILGRSGSTLSTGARVVSAEEVEEVLRGSAGVLDVVVSATPHQRLGSLVTAVVEPDPQVAPDLSDLRHRARDALDPAKRPRRWLAAEIPRTPSGKPARARVAEQLAAGTVAGEVLS